MKFQISLISLLCLPILTSCSSIQKNLKVLDFVAGGSMMEIEEYFKALSKECLKTSISKDDFNKMLSKGVKVVSAIKYEKWVQYKLASEPYLSPNEGKCIGTSYILEGPKSILDSY